MNEKIYIVVRYMKQVICVRIISVLMKVIYDKDNFCVYERGVVLIASNNLLIGIGFLIAGVIVILLGIRKITRCSGRTVGRIIGVREEQETDDEGFNHYYYTPEFEYVVNGQVYRGIGNKSYSKPQKIQIGGNIKVSYNPKKPNEYFTKGGGKILPFLGIMLILLGIIFVTS